MIEKGLLVDIAQLARVPDFQSGGRKFESLAIPTIYACSSVDLERLTSNQRVGGSNPSRRVGE